MKVKQIVARTVWKPGSGYQVRNPQVTVLLPTFRRGKSGLFRKAVESVLNQTFKNLELIIIDDASTDGTAEQIAEFIAQDDRVSCLWHPDNIGLPAISEYEGYLKAKGDYIAFQFDDDEFKLDAIERLLHAAINLNAKFVYGHVDFVVPDEATRELVTVRDFGKTFKSPEMLQYTNYISNNAVMLHRDVVEKIGFYDPNVAMARWCDYDLWRRCAQHFKLQNVDVAVGVVTGPATSDSLGNTYAMEKWLSFEWMNLDRTQQLLPSNFGEVDVLEVPPTLAAVSKNALEELHQSFSRRFWHPANERGLASTKNTPLPEGYVVVVAPQGECLSLTLDNIAGGPFQRVRLVNGFDARNNLEDELSGASAVILLREIFDFSNWADCARALRIPHYFYVDDAALAIVERVVSSAGTQPSATEKLQCALQGFDEVIFETPAIAKKLNGLKLNAATRVLELPFRTFAKNENLVMKKAENASGVASNFIVELLNKHSAPGMTLRETRYQSALRRVKADRQALQKQLIDLQYSHSAGDESRTVATLPANVIAAVPQVFSAIGLGKLARFFWERSICKPNQYAHIASAATALITMREEVVCKTELSNRVFREYAIPALNGAVKTVRMPIAFDCEAASRADFGIEILSPRDQIIYHEITPWRQCYMDGVITFRIPVTSIAESGWRIRVFVRTAQIPVYLFERRPAAWLARATKKPKLFFELSLA